MHDNRAGSVEKEHTVHLFFLSWHLFASIRRAESGDWGDQVHLDRQLPPLLKLLPVNQTPFVTSSGSHQFFLFSVPFLKNLPSHGTVAALLYSKRTQCPCPWSRVGRFRFHSESRPWLRHRGFFSLRFSRSIKTEPLSGLKQGGINSGWLLNSVIHI